MGRADIAVPVRRLARAARTQELPAFLAGLHHPMAILVGPGVLDRSSVSMTIGEPDSEIRFLSPADFDRFEALLVPGGISDLVIGRGEEASVVIPDSSISKRHASLRREPDGRWVLTDLRSRNGTYVRSAMVAGGSAVYVHPGDLIQLGTRVLKLYDPAALYQTLRRLIPTR